MDFRRQMNDFFAQIYRQNELYDIWAKQNRMKPSTVAVLYLLDQFETCTQGWISKIYLLPKQTIHTVVQELEQALVQELACYYHRSNHLNCSAELPLYYHYFHYPYYHLPESLQNHRHRYCPYLRPSLLPSASRSWMLSSRKWMSMLWWSLSWLLW